VGGAKAARLLKKGKGRERGDGDQGRPDTENNHCSYSDGIIARYAAKNACCNLREAFVAKYFQKLSLPMNL
jgi:hypothetical protein